MLNASDRCSPVCGKSGRAIVQAMRPAVTAAAGQPSRRDDGSKAEVNLKRRYGKSTQDDDEHALGDDLEVGVGRLGEDLPRQGDRAEGAEAQCRPEARRVAAPQPVPKRDEAEQPERRRTDVAQDVVDGFRSHAWSRRNRNCSLRRLEPHENHRARSTQKDATASGRSSAPAVAKPPGRAAAG